MSLKHLKICVTGATGQIGYTLLLNLANGSVFGNDTSVTLSLLVNWIKIKFSSFKVGEILKVWGNREGRANREGKKNQKIMKGGWKRKGSRNREGRGNRKGMGKKGR